MENLIKFINVFLSYGVLMLIIVVVAAAAVFIGIRLAIKKNMQKVQAAETKEPQEE